MIVCCVVLTLYGNSCALLVVAYGPCSPLLSLSEHHCAENNGMSESFCLTIVLSSFLCLIVASRQKKILRAKTAGVGQKQIAVSRHLVDKAPAGGKPPMRNPDLD